MNREPVDHAFFVGLRWALLLSLPVWALIWRVLC